jgi:Na+/H+ antiporter NhaD/arsenite permease-like protein
MISGLHSIWIALPILVISYGLIMLDRFDRSVIAMLGGGAMVLSGVISQEEAIRGIDFNTLGLLTGMMILVAIARGSGVFEYLAVRAAQIVGASPAGLLAAFSLITAVLSALLDNVTTVMLIAPVTVAITRRLTLPTYPYLMAEIIASNFGGTATLIGDPPNILIGSAANLSFNDFLIHLTPIVVIVMVVQVAVLHVMVGRNLSADPSARSAVMGMSARASITDKRLLGHFMVVIILVLAGFCTTRFTGWQPGSIALLGAAALMLLDSQSHPREMRAGRATATYGEVDWITIFFFVGLFMLVHGVQATGAIEWLAGQLIHATQGNRMLTASVILWSAAILSAIIDNIPFVAVMIPLIQAMAPGVGGQEGLLPLWVALSLGACFGGNGTLIGASANLTVAGIAERAGIPFSFMRYTRDALPLTVLSIALAQAYLWIRYQ